MKNKTAIQGFTLIELVSVIVLLGILMVSVAPRFSSRDGFAEYAVRDQLISAYRLAQQRALYDHGGDCYRLYIDGDGFSAQQSGSLVGPVAAVSFTGDYNGISVTPAAPIYFDGLGNVSIESCGGNAVSDPLILTVRPADIQLEIYSSGYIRAI